MRDIYAKIVFLQLDKINKRKKKIENYEISDLFGYI